MQNIGRGARPCRHANEVRPMWSGTCVLPHPMPYGSPRMAGMRSRSVGTRARGAGEPYAQAAHVTDAAMVRLTCRPRATLMAWTSLRRWLRGRGTKQEVMGHRRPAPQPDLYLRESGSLTGLTSQRARSTRGTPRQGVNRAPTAAQHLRHEPRRNRWRIPCGVGRLMTKISSGADRPCEPWGSRPTGAVGNAAAGRRA
jgi:hypothetical protein